MTDLRLTAKEQIAIEQSFRNDSEAHALLDLIDAEFRTDPTSVQCFDLRIVQRVRQCVESRKRYVEAHPWAAAPLPQESRR